MRGTVGVDMAACSTGVARPSGFLPASIAARAGF